MQGNLIKKFANNLTYAFTAQLVSLISSGTMSLIISKFLGIEQFSYWQLFIFYSTYVGLFHFGLSDGVYLRYGGVEKKDLDYTLLSSQLKCMNFFHGIIVVIVIVGALFFCSDIERTYAWIFAAIYLFLANILYYIGFIFQAINETKTYSIAIIISKVSFLLFVLVSILFKTESYRPFAILYLLAQIMGTLYIVNKGKLFYYSTMLSLDKTLYEIWNNIKVGINLTISSIASTLILGIGRVLVDINGGLTNFGIVSLAISLTSFILNFLAQISIVLFPMLRKFDKNRIAELYSTLSSLLSYLLCLVLVLFIPFKSILELWLPNYAQSFIYMTILFPICIFDGKMQMLYNTYLKVLRKEKQLLVINIVSMITSTILCAISILLFKQTIAVVMAMVVAIIIRSIISSIFLSNTLSVKFENNIIIEIFLSIIFVYCNLNLNTIRAFIIILIAVGCYWVYNRRHITSIIKKVKNN